MTKESWIEAREHIIEQKIEAFEIKHNHYPNVKEEQEIEDSVTEDEIVTHYANYASYINDMYNER